MPENKNAETQKNSYYHFICHFHCIVTISVEKLNIFTTKDYYQLVTSIYQRFSSVMTKLYFHTSRSFSFVHNFFESTLSPEMIALIKYLSSFMSVCVIMWKVSACEDTILRPSFFSFSDHDETTKIKLETEKTCRKPLIMFQEWIYFGLFGSSFLIKRIWQTENNPCLKLTSETKERIKKQLLGLPRSHSSNYLQFHRL